MTKSEVDSLIVTMERLKSGLSLLIDEASQLDVTQQTLIRSHESLIKKEEELNKKQDLLSKREQESRDLYQSLEAESKRIEEEKTNQELFSLRHSKEFQAKQAELKVREDKILEREAKAKGIEDERVKMAKQQKLLDAQMEMIESSKTKLKILEQQMTSKIERVDRILNN